MKKKVKRKLKKQVIFNLISVIFVSIVGLYFLGRLIYFKIDSEKAIVYSDVFYKRIIELNDTYELQSSFVKTNSVYRFIGNVDNNYVKYKGYMWRIIRINKDNSVTMVTDENVSTLSHINILDWLNKSKEDNTGIFEISLEADNLLKNRLCLDTFKDIEVASCFESNNDYKIGLLSIDDYINAGTVDSYLNNGEYFWTSNNYNSTKVWYIADDGLVSNDELNSKHGIRPVITLSGDTTVFMGDGTADNPYKLANETVTTLADSYVGEYISFNNSLWKIVSKANDKIKIVSETCIKNENDECISKSFSQYSNAFNTNRKNELLYYLNNNYFKTLEHNDYIVEGPFYTGTYSLADNNYKTSFSKKVNLKVGFLSMAEPFAYEVENTFLSTSSPNNDLSIYTVSEHKTLYENIVTGELNVRPSVYLKANIKVIEGNGSYLSPFILGDDE